MKAVLQRVIQAHVEVDNVTVGQIGTGILVLLGVHRDDTNTDADYLAEKLVSLRIFADDRGKMNLSVRDVSGALLIVSQFTLYGDSRKGRRPSFDSAAPPALAKELYDYFVAKLRLMLLTVETGIFQADMRIHLINDGPVTLVLESKI